MAYTVSTTTLDWLALCTEADPDLEAPTRSFMFSNGRKFYWPSDLYDAVPSNALLDRDGNPILDRDGNYILTR